MRIKFDSTGSSADEAEVLRIHKEVGDQIKTGDELFELESEKNNIKITAETDGLMESIEVNTGVKVKDGDLLAVIDEGAVNSKEESDIDKKSEEKEASTASDEESDYDLAVLGAGPGGYVAAIKAAQMGASVVLIEKEKLGGTCLNWGCIPTKTLVRSAEVYKTIKESDKYGCRIIHYDFDWKKILERKDSVVKKLCSGVSNLMKANGVEVLTGKGELVDSSTIKVEGEDKKVVKADNIIIATGSKPSSLDIEGANLPGILDSKKALSLENLPEKMIIVGGGIIGLEFAFIFAAYEVDVTVVEYLDCVIDVCDSEVCREITRIGRKKGIRIVTGAEVQKIVRGVDDSYAVFFNKDGQEELLSGDKVLMAVGRKPVYEGINPEKLGLELNDNGRGIKVNEKMETNLPGVYAVGDVTDKIQLAHAASHQGIVAVKNIMGEEAVMDYSAVPSAIFTDPEIGEVGISEQDAKEKGMDVNIGRFPFAANGKVLAAGAREGFIKIISDKESGIILGASIIGVHATDLLSELTLAVRNKLTAEDLVETIHAHPTTAEVIHEAGLDLEGSALHNAR